MQHSTEDQLIQHLCGENTPADRERLQDHLATCAECRLACEEITAALTMVNDTVPEPPEGFERIVWAKVRQSIELEPRPSRWTWRSLVPAGVVAALAVAGITLVGRPVGSTAPAAPLAASNTANAAARGDAVAQDRVLYTALDSHFQQTEMLLVELRNKSDRDSLDFERLSAGDLISAGRLYRLSAESAGHENLAQVLDDLEPLLVEVARRPDRKLSASDRKWLQSRIDDEGLLFKVRAATNDIRERVGHADY